MVKIVLDSDGGTKTSHRCEFVCTSRLMSLTMCLEALHDEITNRTHSECPTAIVQLVTENDSSDAASSHNTTHNSVLIHYFIKMTDNNLG